MKMRAFPVELLFPRRSESKRLLLPTVAHSARAAATTRSEGLLGPLRDPTVGPGDGDNAAEAGTQPGSSGGERS